MGSATYLLAWLSSSTFPVNQCPYYNAKMTFWNLQGFQGRRYFQLYQPWLSKLSAWYWVAKLELPVLAWPFKLTVLCCHSILSFLFLHYFVILLLLLNYKAVILSLKWYFSLHENTSLIYNKPNIDRGLKVNIYWHL